VTSGSVEVQFFAAARAAVGASTLTAAPGTLGDVLDELTRDHPDFARVRSQCSFLIDGVAVHGDPAAAVLESGMRLDVLPPFAGG
jgi:molybdopterin converting factor small subunit